MGRLHAVVIPFPAQGHVIPLLEFSYCLVDRGFRVTFVNNEYTHQQISSTLLTKKGISSHSDHGIQMVAVSDGMAPEDRHNIGKHCDSMLSTMSANLEKLLRKFNESEAEKVTCVVTDTSMAWVVPMAKMAGVPRAVVLWTMAAGLAALGEKIPELVESKIMDGNGFITAHQMIKLSATMSEMSTKNFLWVCFPEEMQQTNFHYMINCCKSAKMADYVLCNSFHEIEQAAFELVPNLLPIGPLLPGRRTGKPVGHFWQEELSCLDWLDEQVAGSVIYVAFGSFTLLDQRQFEELAFGLDLTEKPFLWVVRPDLMNGSNVAYPEGYEARVAGRGRMVTWAPQLKVLAHPSIGCFISHCGWNSTMEGVANGVPFLCWPYFADQFFNATYICDVWKTGLRLELQEDGIIARNEVKSKVAALLSGEDIRTRVANLKEEARWNVNGGTSAMKLDEVIEGIAQ